MTDWAVSAAGSGSKRHGPDLILSIVNDGATVTIRQQRRIRGAFARSGRSSF
jgi:hypothetical protein